MAEDVPCFRCRTATRAGGLYCGPCRAAAHTEAAGHQPAFGPLSYYGEPERPVPTGKGSTDVAFWKAIVREAMAEQVAGQVKDQLDRKLVAVRSAYAQLREDVRLNGDGLERHEAAMNELEKRIEDAAGIA